MSLVPINACYGYSGYSARVFSQNFAHTHTHTHRAHAKKVPYNVDIKIQFAKRAIAINITVQTAQCTM